MGNGTGIGRVRGLGSAHHGTHHWWHQRLTAGANLLLLTWVVGSLFRLPLHDYRAMLLWISNPWVSVGLILATVTVFYHMRLGLQVVVEDYQHDFSRIVLLVLINFYCVGGAALAIFAILKIALLPGAAS
jgi:succinate dehydrogenase / fumarate reductase membrane anchor subunit